MVKPTYVLTTYLESVYTKLTYIQTREGETDPLSKTLAHLSCHEKRSFASKTESLKFINSSSAFAQKKNTNQNEN